MNWWDHIDDPFQEKGVWDAVLEAYSGGARSGRMTTQSGWIRARCPICEADGSKDRKESLGLNTKTGGFNCYKCQTHGRLPASYRAQLSDILDPDLEDSFEVGLMPNAPSAITAAVEHAYGFTPIFEGPGLADPRFDAVRHYILAPKTDLNEGGKPCRDIPFERARQMGIGSGTFKLAGRLVIPILNWEDPTGPWLAWFARDATGLNQIPHLYSRGLSRYTTIWNGAALFVETDEPVFIMEGCLDAQAVWPHGVACLGKPIPAHHSLFLQTRRPIVVCLDGDAWMEGQALAWSLALQGARAVNLRLPARTDPDEVPRDWLFETAHDLLKKA